MVTHIYPKTEGTTISRDKEPQTDLGVRAHTCNPSSESVKKVETDHVAIVYNEDSLKAIRDIIFEKDGFDLDSYKDKCIQRRISLRVRISGCRTPEDYITLLKKDDVEIRKLVDALTINVTEFFRNHTTYAKLRDIALPGIFGTKKDDKTIKIWSAGCASGEEPYSISIMLKRFFPEELEKFNISLVATDVDEKILKKAGEGIYTRDKLAGVNPMLIEAFFDHEEGRYRLSDDIKKMVSFRREDIFREEMPGGNDLIICRNMLIYFSKEKQEWVLKEFWKNLNPGGFLILGRAEILIGESRKLFTTICPRERIYRKPF